MKFKNFFLAGLAGGIADFLLGWLVYGILLYNYFGGHTPNMTFITLGCLAFGFFISYVLVSCANVTTFAGGLKVGAVFGLLYALTMDLFELAGKVSPDFEKYAVDVAVTIVLTAIIGGVVAAVNGALSKPAN
jgi:hypothetical protein